MRFKNQLQKIVRNHYLYFCQTSGSTIITGIMMSFNDLVTIRGIVLA